MCTASKRPRTSSAKTTTAPGSSSTGSVPDSTPPHLRTATANTVAPTGVRTDASTSATSDSAGVRPITAILDARSQDESIASVDFAQNPAQQITWRHLFEVTTSIANGLLDLGVRPGDRVSMLVPPG